MFTFLNVIEYSSKLKKDLNKLLPQKKIASSVLTIQCLMLTKTWEIKRVG